MANNFLQLIQLLSIPFWVSMILFPRNKLTQNLVTSYWPFIAFGCIYFLVIASAISTNLGGFNLSFEGLKSVLSSDWGVVVAWTHFITLDLFAGVWIFRDAKYWRIQSGFYLILTMFAGPLGLGLYLLSRQRKMRNDPAQTLN